MQESDLTNALEIAQTVVTAFVPDERVTVVQPTLEQQADMTQAFHCNLRIRGGRWVVGWTVPDAAWGDDAAMVSSLENAIGKAGLAGLIKVVAPKPTKKSAAKSEKETGATSHSGSASKAGLAEAPVIPVNLAATDDGDDPLDILLEPIPPETQIPDTVDLTDDFAAELEAGLEAARVKSEPPPPEVPQAEDTAPAARRRGTKASK